MAKTFLEMLAPAVQRLKSTFYGLHHRCKSQKVVFAICTTGATAQKQFFPFAPMVQETKSGFFCLHHRCKRQKEVFEVCTGGASISKSTLAATARYQRHSSGIRESILSSNSRYYKGTCAYVHIFLSAVHAPPNSKNVGLQNVLPEECAEIHLPRFMRLKNTV